MSDDSQKECIANANARWMMEGFSRRNTRARGIGFMAGSENEAEFDKLDCVSGTNNELTIATRMNKQATWKDEAR